MNSFHFVLVRIVVDHENLLSLIPIVVHFDFVQLFKYLFQFLSFLVHLHNFNCFLQSYFCAVCMMILLLVETFGNPFVNIFVQQRVLLWIV